MPRDGLEGRDLPADAWDLDIREVAALPEWQELRAGMVGTWKRRPTANVVLLRGFLGEDPDDRRVRIVLAYLHGVRSRMGRFPHPEVDRLLAEVRATAEARTRHLKGKVIA